jgi:hypothetical protein
VIFGAVQDGFLDNFSVMATEPWPVFKKASPIQWHCFFLGLYFDMILVLCEFTLRH